MRKKTATLEHPSSVALVDEQKPTVVSLLAKPSPNGQPVSEEAIRLCAYCKWEAAGKPDGDGVRFWLDAEKELSSRQSHA
jgi:hypothetical protein